MIPSTAEAAVARVFGLNPNEPLPEEARDWGHHAVWAYLALPYWEFDLWKSRTWIDREARRREDINASFAPSGDGARVDGARVDARNRAKAT